MKSVEATQHGQHHTLCWPVLCHAVPLTRLEGAYINGMHILLGNNLLLYCIIPQEYIARFGHGSAKLARQAQSKEKTLAKMVRGGLTDKVEVERGVRLKFADVGKLPPPVLQFTNVTFGYSKVGWFMTWL